MPEFTRVIPLLVYRDLQAAHDFLVRVFGFESGGIERGADGVPMHAEVRAGDSVFWLHRHAAEQQLDSPRHAGSAGGGLVVHVADVDAHFARAREAGAQIGYQPTDQDYGQREYEAHDPEGHRWWFATPLAAADAQHSQVN